MSQTVTLKRLLAAAAACLVVGLVGFGIYEVVDARLDDRVPAEIIEESRVRGAADATADIRRRRIVLRNSCHTQALTQAWARRGVDCPFTPTTIRGGFQMLPESQAKRAYWASYDAVMERHVRARYGPRALQDVREETYRASSSTP
jgi:hypothetical protein